MSDARTAWGLLGQGRAREALEVTTVLLGAPAGASALMAHAAALKALGRPAEALAFNRKATAISPGDRIAWYNLAATLGDLALAEEGEAAARQAIALGLEAPEAHLVLARALQLQHRYKEAEALMREAIVRRPNYPDALRDLAQLIWMTTADAAQALTPVDAALADAPGDPGLHHLRATVQEFAGDLEGAAASLSQGLSREPGDLRLLIKASHVAAARGRPAEALTQAGEAVARAPALRAAQEALALANLAAGQAKAASEIAGRLLASAPFDQMAIGLQADAWRLLGDARYRALYDYDAFVRPYTIETPPGWPDLAAFLADLTRSLDGLHRLQTHPLQQSLRHGSQVQSLLASDDPAIRAFFASAEKAVARYVVDVGQGDDPLRARNTGAATIHTAWSVRLRPTGFHVNHFHPQGWLSSAFYVETPAAALGTPDREGWIKFGEPGIATQPRLGPEHFVRPQPGLLVLFPSYMWHGTIPFTSDERRMSIAFDVLPK